MPKPTPHKSQQGFTLIEVLVAVILITMVIAPLEGLLIRAEKLSTAARQRFIATNLAQEGLELVHATRDNNWFSSSEPDRWLDHGLCQQGNNSYEDSDRRFTLDPNMVRAQTVGDLARPQLYLQANGTWLHDISSQPTTFSRILSIDCSTKFSESPYVTVSATVTWQEQDQPQQLVLKEKLYNWYPNTRPQTP